MSLDNRLVAVYSSRAATAFHVTLKPLAKVLPQGEPYLWVYHSNPIRVSENQYYRTFTASWTAEPGTHRITGERLHYKIQCDVIIPVE